MKRMILAIMMIATTAYAASAQSENGKRHKSGKQQSEAVEQKQYDPKEGFKKALDLTDEQAEAFFPIYKEYRQALRGEKPQAKPEQINPAEATDEQTLEFLNERLDREIHIATVRKAYIQKFLTVLTPKQIAKLYKMESSFGHNNPHGRAPQHGTPRNNDTRKGPQHGPRPNGQAPAHK